MEKTIHINYEIYDNLIDLYTNINKPILASKIIKSMNNDIISYFYEQNTLNIKYIMILMIQLNIMIKYINYQKNGKLLDAINNTLECYIQEINDINEIPVETKLKLKKLKYKKNNNSISENLIKLTNSLFSTNDLSFFKKIIKIFIKDLNNIPIYTLYNFIYDSILYHCLQSNSNFKFKKIPIDAWKLKIYITPDLSYLYTLILDLDETLIHNNKIMNTMFSCKDFNNYYIVRPYAFEFIEELSEFYEIVIFTSGTINYAESIINEIDRRNIIKNRLYRNHCTPYLKSYYKDISKIGREISKLIIIDNIADNFKKNEDNGLLIKSWHDDMNDEQLLGIKKILKMIYNNKISDVREILKDVKMKVKKENIMKEKNPYNVINDIV